MQETEIQSLWLEFTNLLRSTNRVGVENVIKWLDETDFKYAPASTQYHSSFTGGLLKHSLNVYYALFDFKSWIDFMEIPSDTLIITSLLHDVCKIESYIVSTKNKKDENGNWITVPFYQYEEVRPWGHGDKSVILLLQKGLQLTDVEVSMIRNHMGFTGSDDERRVSRLFRICPQSLLLHCADLEATMLLESFDGPQRFIDKLNGGRNINECLSMSDMSKFITVDGMTYEVASANEPLDNEKIIKVNYNGKDVNVYSPHGDGLPF